jgi:hypothetical protein
MADKKISELATSATSIGGYVPIVIGGAPKKVLVGPGGGFDADTVSGYGIGVNAPIASNIGTFEANDGPSGGGVYQYSSPTGTLPGGASIGTLLHLPQSATGAYQIAFPQISGGCFVRLKIGSAWAAWYQVWAADSDGNGGQPPAPKTTIGTTAGLADGANEHVVMSAVTGVFHVMGINGANGKVVSSIIYNSAGTLYRNDTSTDASITITHSGSDIIFTKVSGGGTVAISYAITQMGWST